MNLRHAVRSLRRNRTFTIAVVLTLSFGIGANVAMFEIVDRLLLRSVNLLRDPDSVHRVYWQFTSTRTGVVSKNSMNYGQYLDIRESTTSFSDYAVFGEQRLPVGTGEAARERQIAAVSSSFFRFFNAAPAAGRYFSEEEDIPPGGAPVAVLSHSFWQTELGGGDVLGRTLDVGDVRATIVGVAPKDLIGVADFEAPSVFIPLAAFSAAVGFADDPDFYRYYRFEWANVLVRRAPGITVEQASADVRRAVRRSWEEQLAEGALRTPLATAQPHGLVGAVRRAGGPSALPEVRIALWVAGLAVIVLIVAIANVANLILVRGLQQQRDTTVRLALGVSRWQLAGQVIMESTLLALCGGAGALLVAHWGGATLRALLLPTSAISQVTFSDARVLGFTLAIALLVGIAIGMLPALLIARSDLASGLRMRSGGGSKRANQIRAVLLVSQAALSVALLIGALFFVRSHAAVKAVPQGYSPDQVLIVEPIARGTALDAPSQEHLRRELLAAAQAIPGVRQAAWTGAAPLWRSAGRPLFIPGVDSVQARGQFNVYAVEPAYFAAMDTRIIRGRAIAAEDVAGAPAVAVVSESMGRTFWPGQDALGQCIRLDEEAAPCTMIVGIAQDAMQTGQYVSDRPRFQYYLSLQQYPLTETGFLVLRVQDDAPKQIEAIRGTLQRHMPAAFYVNVQPMADLLANTQRPWRLGATLFMALGLLALAVAAIGLYGVIGYNVAQRMNELAVRVALGAQRQDIIGLVLGQSMRFAVAGSALGGLLALAGGRWLEPLLYQQSTRSPAVYAAVAAAILGIALAASLLPALRAAQADPNRVLRAE